MNKRLETIDGETLMNMPLKPIPFFIDTLLSQGLHLLAGAPKTGKSWFALWLCLQVATGEPVWNWKTKQGTALYLCLEDSTLRIQNRLFEISEDAPPTIIFTTESLSIGQGLEEQLETFITENKDTALIIIDTLQMVRSTRVDSSYANDYQDLNVLKKVADKYEIAILLIHHLRKEDDKDTFNCISGTTGITGAVDSSFTLVEQGRGKNKATLSCVGRDIPNRELELEKNEENIWTLLSDSLEEPEMLQDKIIPAIKSFMEDKEFYSGTATELAGLLLQFTKSEISNRKLAKKIVQNKEELESLGITSESKRSKEGRVIILEKVSDGNVDK